MDLSDTESLYHDLGQFAQERFGFKKPPTLNLVSDGNNENKPLGKTAYYDPQSMAVTIYTDNRHTKDMLRSLAHELVHHTQNENGMLNDSGYHGAGYAQKNKDLRQSEKEAYLKGNMCFRDWEDGLKQDKPTIYNEWRINNMSTKNWKNKELMENISGKFGFKMDLGLLKEEKEKESEEKEEESEESEETEKGDKSTSKYDDNPALKGDQDKLPDALQKGIISAQNEGMKEAQVAEPGESTKAPDFKKPGVRYSRKEVEMYANKGNKEAKKLLSKMGDKTSITLPEEMKESRIMRIIKSEIRKQLKERK